MEKVPLINKIIPNHPKQFNLNGSLAVITGGAGFVGANLIKYLLKKKIKPPDYFIHLRPTTPLRKIKTLNRAINHFKKNSKNFTSMRSVSLMSHPSFKTMKIVRGKLCSIFLGIDVIVLRLFKISSPITPSPLDKPLESIPFS